MTKKDLAKEIAGKTGLNMSQATLAIDAVSQAVVSSLAFSQPVYLRGFGTFRVERRAARTARDINHGVPISIPARGVVRFIPSKQLKDLVR